MFRNYLAAALRNLVRNRVYASINIAGLALGFTAALLIALFVRDELSYDRFFPDYQHIYLVGSETSLPGRATETPDVTPGDLAPLLKADFPEVGAITRLGPEDVLVRQGASETVEDIVWADPSIFEVFKFPVVAGSLDSALVDAGGIVITRSIARKYFGRDDPLGQVLTFTMISSGGTSMNDAFKVTAVIADLPSNTNLNIGIIASGRNANSFFTRDYGGPPRQDSWRQDSFTYLKLASDGSAARMQGGFNDFMKRHKAGIATPGDGLYVKLTLRPIASQHLTPGLGLTWKPRGNIAAVIAAAAIGVLIVFAAGTNFVNLMTARAMRRATEVGVRKATGAARRHLIAQFIGEATLYVIIAMGCGLGFATALLPRLNAFLDRTIGFELLSDIRSLGFVGAMVVLTGVLAGAYPAFVLAALRPAGVLRGIIGQQTSSRLRPALVVLQFAVLIGILIPTAVVYSQTRYALSEAQRLDTDKVVFVRNLCLDAFKEGLQAIPGVRAVACSAAFSFGANGGGAPTRTTPAKQVNGAFVTVGRVSVSSDFFAFFGLKTVAGRFFAEGRSADVMPSDQDAAIQGAVVLNETAVRLLGFASPEDAVGKFTSLNEKTGAPSEIIGVVEDFAFDAVHKVVPAIVYYTGRDPLFSTWVRIDGARAPETLNAIDQLWRQVGTPLPPAHDFLDQRIAGFYADITRQGTLFAVFAAAAVAVAVLGLFGLTLFTAEQRTKEIGIRKSMGATRRDILALLLWQFAKPVLIANLIAWPVAYYFMKRWLEGFAYHIDLSPWMFLAASALALVIAVTTVIGHALLVARAQPVTALRYE